jgi:mRNA-degrading endonuclease RelE of RelBE toxin-antitoxin system
MTQFRISDTFTASLARLTGDEQRAVKTAAFDLQMNPAHPGLQLHKLDRARDPNFWSVRVSRDVRLIVHKTAASFLLCYVDHHDRAYSWAERRRLETHPKTGAAQLVEVRETVREITVPLYVAEEQPAQPKPPLFSHISEDDLLAYGVPAEWLNDVRRADEDSLLVLADHLPGEAAEALLELATGGKPRIAAQRVDRLRDPFEHPDALRRFRVMSNVEELERALEFPWERWTVFLHPEQQDLVEREYSGPARVSGSAGTGKTVVAIHRAVHLVRAHPEARVLLTTFSDALANSLRAKLRLLIGNETRLGERLEVHSMDEIGRRLYESNFGRIDLASREEIRQLLEEAADEVEGNRFGPRFLLTEWEQVVDAWQLGTWEEYRDVRRLGRKTRLPEQQRRVLWSIFDRVRSGLQARNLLTTAGMFGRLTSHYEDRHPPFDFAVVDEAQDIGVAQLRFLAALGGNRPNSLFFAGDLGQRIFQQPFSWKALGVDIRGRSRTLRINYRTSHQIRMQADRLLGPEVSDVDGNKEERLGTVSVFNGPLPEIRASDSPEDEARLVCEWLLDLREAGVMPHEIGIFVRSVTELDRARSAIEDAGLPYKVLDENAETIDGQVSLGTMHLAKGMEFRAVAVMACDDEVIPSQNRVETVTDDADLLEVYDTERHLLYVACTRARDCLLVTSGDTPSEFLDDLRT